MHSRLTLCRRWLASLLLLGLTSVLGLPPLAAAPVATKTFDVPAGTAPATLQQFSAQAGGHLLYSAEVVAGLKTPAVKGELTPREALTRMLAGSRLRVVEDAATGALTISGDGPPAPDRTPADPGKPNRSSRNPSSDRDNEAVMLPSFTVEAGAETGYAASHSISATKISTELKKMPLSIDIITEELFKDYGHTEVLDMISMSSGVTFTQVATGSGPSEAYTIRGFTSFRQARNGNINFRSYDSANVARVELVNGPASVLYGQLDPGGIVNTVTKQPAMKAASDLRVDFGSWQYRRIQAGTTGPLNAARTLAYRVDASALNRAGYRDHDGMKKQFVAPAVKWRPWPRTTLNLDLEYAETDRSGTAFWPRYIDRANNVIKWADLIPPTFNSQVPGLGSNYENLIYTGTIEQAFGDRVLVRNQSGVSSQRYFGTSASSVNINRNARGQVLYSRPFGGARKSDRTFANTLNLAARYDFGPRHYTRFVLGWDYNETRSATETRRAGAGASVPDPVAWDLAADPATWDRSVPTYEQARVNALSGQRTWDDKFYLVDALALFDERLMFLGGLNYSSIDILALNHVANSRLRIARDRLTPQGGALWRVAPQLGLYVNYSESFLQLAALRTNKDASLTPFDPLIAEGLDFGVKYEFWEGRLGGQVTVFKVRYLNARQQFREDSGFTYETQTGESESQGVEFRASANPTKSWQFVASYTYTDAKVTKNPAAPEIVGRPISRAPRHSATLTTSYRIAQGRLKGLSFGANASYRNVTRAFETTDPFFLDARIVVNARASYAVRLWAKPVTLQLLVSNVFDKFYFPSSNGPADPTSFRLSADTRF
ncbi:MAG: TonB-dependent receptor [Verrucomicrobia bacterium]|nr:TonB-dependent receptor [Verrucomicrobiota bacterium]